MAQDKTREKRKTKPKQIFELKDYRGKHRGVFTWSEVINNELLEVSKEILGAATHLKDKLKTFLGSIIIGHNIAHLAQELIEYGADKVIVVEHPDLQEFTTRAYTEAITQVLKDYKPEIFIFGATTTGRDLAPRIAARLQVGLSADCTELDIGEYISRSRKERYEKVGHFIRPSFGESKLATIIGPWTYPQMATVRPGAMTSLQPDTSRKGEINKMKVTIPESELQVKILETVRAGNNGDKMTGVDPSANIIVSGGYGIGNDGFDVLRAFVKTLNENGQNASLGASRKAVDAGFISSNHQVGQTGKTVRPHWYLAVGISGAIQHLAGIKYCKKIVVINKDPDAPLFEHADYGIVGRYEDIIPELIKAVENGSNFPPL